MRSIVLILFHLVGGAIQVVDRARSLVDVAVASRRKGWIANRADHLQGPRRDQRSNRRKIAQEGIHEINTVAVLLDRVQFDMVLDRPCRAYRRRNLETLISRRREPGYGSTARDASHRNFLRVYF